MCVSLCTLCSGRSCTGEQKEKKNLFTFAGDACAQEEPTGLCQVEADGCDRAKKSPVFMHSWWHSEYTVICDLCRQRRSLWTPLFRRRKSSRVCVMCGESGGWFQDPVRSISIWIFPASRNTRIHVGQFLHNMICMRIWIDVENGVKIRRYSAVLALKIKNLPALQFISFTDQIISLCVYKWLHAACFRENRLCVRACVCVCACVCAYPPEDATDGCDGCGARVTPCRYHCCSSLTDRERDGGGERKSGEEKMREERGWRMEEERGGEIGREDAGGERRRRRWGRKEDIGDIWREVERGWMKREEEKLGEKRREDGEERLEERRDEEERRGWRRRERIEERGWRREDGGERMRGERDGEERGWRREPGEVVLLWSGAVCIELSEPHHTTLSIIITTDCWSWPPCVTTLHSSTHDFLASNRVHTFSADKNSQDFRKTRGLLSDL